MLSPCLFNVYAEHIKWNAGLEEAQAGIKIAGRNINNLRYADDTTLTAESEEELRSLLMKVKESETAFLKLNVQKTKIRASGPITSWQIDGENVETVSDFIFLGLQNHCGWWLQPQNQKTLALWKKSYDQPRQHIKKPRHLPTKVRLVKAMVFPAVMYGRESWTIKKAEHQRTDAFKLWCWRRLLRVPWTAKRWNQSILKEINPEYSLKGLVLKLKLQYFGHLIQKANSGKDSDAGKVWGQEEKEWQRVRGSDSITDSVDTSLRKLRRCWRPGKPGVLQFLGS